MPLREKGNLKVFKNIYGGNVCMGYKSILCFNSTLEIKNISAINSKAFKNCKLLKKITIFDGVTYIGNYAFCGCSSLQEITIPSSVTKLGIDIFKGIKNVVNVFYLGFNRNILNQLKKYNNIIVYSVL